MTLKPTYDIRHLKESHGQLINLVMDFNHYALNRKKAPKRLIKLTDEILVIAMKIERTI